MAGQNAYRLVDRGHPMNRKLILPAILLLVVSTFQAAHGTVLEDNYTGPVCDSVVQSCWLRLSILGEITAADSDNIKKLVDRTHQQAKNNNWQFVGPLVDLNTPGGSVPAALAIGRLLRKEQATVRVESGAICYSACVLVLAGAVGRTMDGRVGIHRPRLPVPQGEITADKITEQFQTTLDEIRAYFHEMNVNEQLADAMLQIEPEHMRVLSRAELGSYGHNSRRPNCARDKGIENRSKVRLEPGGVHEQKGTRRQVLREPRHVLLSKHPKNGKGRPAGITGCAQSRVL